MRHAVALLSAVCLFSVASSRWIAGQQARPVVSTEPTSIDEVLLAVRADMQTERAGIMGKNLSMTAAQAAKFWPAWDAYQNEQNLIMDAHLKGIQTYIELSLVYQLEMASKIPLAH